MGPGQRHRRLDDARYLDKVLKGLRHARIAFTTAKDAKMSKSVLDATELYKQAGTKDSPAD